MTKHEFTIRLLDLEGSVIRCQNLVNVSAFRTEIQNVRSNRDKYKAQDYKEIISKGFKKLENLVGTETYERMFVIKVPSYSKIY